MIESPSYIYFGAVERNNPKGESSQEADVNEMLDCFSLESRQILTPGRQQRLHAEEHLSSLLTAPRRDSENGLGPRTAYAGLDLTHPNFDWFHIIIKQSSSSFLS